MEKTRMESYEEFSKIIEFPVLVFQAETGKVVFMNYEARLILGQQTRHIELKKEITAENSRFFSKLHDRKAMTARWMILSNGEQEIPIVGVVNEFEESEQTYYMLMFEQRAATGIDYRMVAQTIENSNVIIAHIEFRNDRELNVNFISKNVNRFGYTSEEFYNRKRMYIDIIYPDDRDMVVRRFIEAENTKKDTDSIEHRIITESQKIRFVRSHVHFTRNSFGTIEGMELVIVDVTEGEIRKTEIQYLTDAVEQSNHVVIAGRFRNGESVVTYASSNAGVLGMDIVKLRGHDKVFSDYVVEEDRPMMRDILYNARNINLSDYSNQCRIIGDDGKLRWLKFYVIYKVVDDTAYDIEVLLSDATEEKKYEQSLIQGQKDLKEKLEYVTNVQVESAELECEDFLSREDVGGFLESFAQLNQVYVAGMDVKGHIISKPVGPMMRLGEFYGILERPEYLTRITDAVAQLDGTDTFDVVELEEDVPERQVGIVPILVGGQVVSVILLCGLEEEMVMRVHNSIESLQKLMQILVDSRYSTKYMEADSRKSRMAEDTMRKELEGQLILTKAFAHMQSDTNATVQEIIEKSCELLKVSSIAIYYGKSTQDGFACIAKYAGDEHRNWDYPDHSWRIAQLCREHPELSKGGYVVYGTGEYVPQMEAIMTNIQSHSMLIYGIMIQGEICGSLVLATQEKRFFNEQEIAYCTDVASIIQGILQREYVHKNEDIHDMDLLNTYNYMSECVFIKDVQSKQVLFANEAMENMFGIDVTGIDSRSFLSELTPIYTREGVQAIGDVKHQSFVSHVNKIMDIQELSIQWRDGRDAKVVIMREQQGGQSYD